MASPPYRSPATSPPYPPHAPLPNPKKRPSHSLPQSSKRRKPSALSTISNSTHPLRQTSFPPEESGHASDARSPSVDSDVTGVTGGRSVMTTGTGAGVKKKKARRKKGPGSTKSGGEKGTVDGRSGTGQAVDEGADDEEEEGEGDEGLLEDEGKVDKVAERKNLAVLVDSFNDDQNDRYDMYRRVKLKKETVRKIANQTLSQSVPPAVITTINGYTKMFIGTLIERAREVQQQHANSSPTPTSPTPHSHSSSNNPLSDPFAFIDGSPLDPPPKKKNTDLGPLLPDHLREALRRYKRDGEGGGTGLAGVSLGLGVPGTGAARLGGRRMFR